jgi:uncharacterized protein
MRLLNIVAFTFLSLLLSLFSSGLAYSQSVEVPKLSQRVTDLTSTLSAQETEVLAQKLETLEKTKGSQIAVLLVPTTGEESIEQFSIRVVDEWKLGRKDIDDGVLLLIAKNDKRIRIEVGRGLEGALPDVIAARIIREYVRPAFRDNDYVGGINIGVDKISAVIQGELLPPPQNQGSSHQYSDGKLFGLPFIAWIIILVVGLITSKIAGGWVGRGGAGIASIGATAFAGTPIGIALIIGLVMTILISILGTRVFWDIVSVILQNSGRGGGGSGSGGGSSNGGFSGGGGGFGGGGASGDW